MAVIKDFYTSNGVHVRVYDDLMAKPGSLEAKLVEDEINRAAYACLLSAAKKRVAERTIQIEGATENERSNISTERQKSRMARTTMSAQSQP